MSDVHNKKPNPVVAHTPDYTSRPDEGPWSYLWDVACACGWSTRGWTSRLHAENAHRHHVENAIEDAPAVEPEQDDCVEYVPGMIRNVEPEQPTCGIAGCEGKHAPQDHNAALDTTTNLGDAIGRPVEGPCQIGEAVAAERARIERIIEKRRAWYLSHMDVPFVEELDDLLAAIRGGDDA